MDTDGRLRDNNTAMASFTNKFIYKKDNIYIKLMITVQFFFINITIVCFIDLKRSWNTNKN